MSWKSMGELMADMKDAHKRIKEGEIQHQDAHAEARILSTAVKGVQVRLEHARLTKRLVDNDATLPDVVLA